MGVASDWSAKRKQAVAEGDKPLPAASAWAAARLRFALHVIIALALAACGGKGAVDQANENSPAANSQPALKPPEALAAYPIAVIANAACVLDGFIYVTGGYGHRDEKDNAEFVNRAYRYSPRENQWERLPDMPVARCFHACAAAEGKVWLFGGMSEAGGVPDVTQVDCYDPESRKWTTPTNLPTPRNRLAAAAIGPRVYVVGGIGNGDSGAVEAFDTSTLKWSDGPSLPKPGHGLSLAAVGDKLVAIGGSGKPEGTWILENGKWRDGSDLPGPHVFAAAVAVDQHVLLLGNRAGGDNPLLRYDMKANKWEQVADKSIEAHRTAAVYLDGKVYVIAGEDLQGGELSRVSEYDPISGQWRHSP